jgi:hypothetical protein
MESGTCVMYRYMYRKFNATGTRESRRVICNIRIYYLFFRSEILINCGLWTQVLRLSCSTFV